MTKTQLLTVLAVLSIASAVVWAGCGGGGDAPSAHRGGERVASSNAGGAAHAASSGAPERLTGNRQRADRRTRTRVAKQRGGGVRRGGVRDAGVPGGHGRRGDVGQPRPKRHKAGCANQPALSKADRQKLAAAGADLQAAERQRCLEQRASSKATREKLKAAGVAQPSEPHTATSKEPVK